MTTWDLVQLVQRSCPLAENLNVLWMASLGEMWHAISSVQTTALFPSPLHLLQLSVPQKHSLSSPFCHPDNLSRQHCRQLLFHKKSDKADGARGHNASRKLSLSLTIKDVEVPQPLVRIPPMSRSICTGGKLRQVPNATRKRSTALQPHSTQPMTNDLFIHGLLGAREPRNGFSWLGTNDEMEQYFGHILISLSL